MAVIVKIVQTPFPTVSKISKDHLQMAFFLTGFYTNTYIHFKAIIATSVYLQKISTTNIYFSHLFISISSRCINK